MFGLSLGELAVIGIIALIVIGPEQLPKVARTVAKVINDLKRATNEFSGHLMDIRNTTTRTVETSLEDVKKQLGLDKLEEEMQLPPDAGSPVKKDEASPDHVVDHDNDHDHDFDNDHDDQAEIQSDLGKDAEEPKNG